MQEVTTFDLDAMCEAARQTVAEAVRRRAQMESYRCRLIAYRKTEHYYSQHTLANLERRLDLASFCKSIDMHWLEVIKIRNGWIGI